MSGDTNEDYFAEVILNVRQMHSSPKGAEATNDLLRSLAACGQFHFSYFTENAMAMLAEQVIESRRCDPALVLKVAQKMADCCDPQNALQKHYSLLLRGVARQGLQEVDEGLGCLQEVMTFAERTRNGRLPELILLFRDNPNIHEERRLGGYPMLEIFLKAPPPSASVPGKLQFTPPWEPEKPRL